jgi:carboxypeptidase C (cathepsin A)
MENTFARSPHARLFVAEGYFDLATIYYGFEWTLAHLHISPQVRSHNIRVERYPSGHMIYTDAAALRQLSKDLHDWL